VTINEIPAGEHDEARRMFAELSNWGRWGHDDERGTLNNITSTAVQRAAGLVRTGRTVSCSRPVGFRKTTMPTDNVMHLMTRAGPDEPAVGEGGASDWIGIGLHGVQFTHIDAHSHVFWDGQMYNGRPKELVSTERGALAGGLEPVFDGVVSRGVLVDMPALFNVDALAPNQAIGPEDLDRWFKQSGAAPESGDVLYVRTGYSEVRSTTDSRPTAGLAASCLPLIREADIAVLVSDGINDVTPSGFEDVRSPVHAIGIAGMGLWLVDNAQLGPLAAACQEEGRYEFMTILAPIPFRRATGSLVNPLAIF
jgi:kynurenine formamidase